jgi:hypothetical protein
VTRAFTIVCCFVFACPAAAAGQEPRPSALAIDSVAAIDETVDANGNYATGVIVDSLVSLEIGRGFQGIVRPFAQRLASTGEWNRQIWVATLRYEHQGSTSVRVDAGYIAPPIGLANLTLRPHLNPTIAQPSSLFQPLPSLQVRGPRTNLLGAIYPLGAVATVSSLRWDLRGGIIDSSPLRARRVFAQVNPPQFANLIVGGGITPVVGLRLGASFSRGGWVRAGETPAVTTDRNATVVTVESEFAFRYTKVAGEWVRDAVDTNDGTRVASGWYVQGQQTLAPRWFLASRLERMSSPLVVAIPGTTTVARIDRLHFNGVEETLGYHLTPDITLRAAHRARRGFGRPGFDHTVAVSAVFARRWI